MIAFRGPDGDPMNGGKIKMWRRLARIEPQVVPNEGKIYQFGRSR
jgi:hypothetical protein